MVTAPVNYIRQTILIKIYKQQKMLNGYSWIFLWFKEIKEISAGNDLICKVITELQEQVVYVAA